MNRTKDWHDAPSVACEHIAAYYQWRWENHKCIAFNLLRRGYRQWAEGRVEWANNLYDVPGVDVWS